MTTTLLAYFPSPSRGVWHLGPVPIRAYALCIIVGIVAALMIGDRRWAARGGERGVIYDIALWAVPFGLVGGRLYHLITDWPTYFGETGAGADAALRIWDGGLGIWGAVAFGAVGAWIGCRWRGIPLPAFGDAIAPGIVLAQAIGRLGNYFNQELYGRETAVPWGMEIFYRRDPSGIVDVHSLDGVSTGQVALVVEPTFLYELLWDVLIFVALIYLDRRFKIGHGRLFALYVAGYCVGRFGIELLRDDPATMIADIRVNSFTSTFVFIGAVVYLILAPKGREDPASLGGNRIDEEEVAEPEVEPAVVGSTSGVMSAADAESEPAEVAAGEVGSEAGEVEPEEEKVEAVTESTAAAVEPVAEEEVGSEAGEVEPEEEVEPEPVEAGWEDEDEAVTESTAAAVEPAAEEEVESEPAGADEDGDTASQTGGAEEPVEPVAEPATGQDVDSEPAEESVEIEPSPAAGEVEPEEEAGQGTDTDTDAEAGADPVEANQSIPAGEAPRRRRRWWRRPKRR
jgi:prolipoprotein diacylglyceryl transferase